MRGVCLGTLLLAGLAAPLWGQMPPGKVQAAPALTLAPPGRQGADNLPAFIRSLPDRPIAPDPGSPPAPAPIPAIPLDPGEVIFADRGPGKEVFAACKPDGTTKGNPAETIKACDVILSYPAYDDLFWPDRGAMLLRRGRMLLQLGLRERAFESFDAAGALANSRGDPFWEVSGGLADRLTRSALRYADPGSEGETGRQIHDLLATRHFSPTHLETIHDFLSIGTRDPDSLLKDYEREARVHPARYVSLTHLYLLTGKFDLAARAARQITLTEPSRREGWKLAEGANLIENQVRRINLLGLQAYASAAGGDAAGKAAYLAAARQLIQRMLDPITLQALGSRERMEREKQAPNLQGIVAEWEQAIQSRQDLVSKGPDGILKQLTEARNRRDLLPAYVAMIAEMGRQNDENASRARLLAGNYIDRNFFHHWSGNKDEFVEKLPNVETFHSLGKIDRNLGMWFDGSLTGYSQSRDPGSKEDIRTVHYEAGEGTRELAEELLTLAIARYARKDGYDGFVILSRHTIPRFVHDYGQDIGAGYDAQARVLMIRGGQLPAGSTLAADRIITIDEVDRDLGPRFNRYADYQAKKRAEEQAGKELRKQAKKAARN